MKKNGKKYLSIRDISRIAGVSTATVSRVINSPETTSEAIREKVMAVIEEYNYVPNQMAKNLFSMTSNSIAIFVYDMENPFFISLIKELNNIAFENKYTLLVCDTENNIDKEREYLKYCQSIRCSGIILTEGVDYDLFQPDNHNQNIAFLDRFSNIEYSSVRSDNRKGIKLLVDYLYNLNHRKIAFAGVMEGFQSAIERKNSYIDALRSHDLEIKEEYIYTGGFGHKTGVNALDYFWSQDDKPTAVICANDQIAKGLIMKAYKLNISVPDDLSVVGFDGVDSAYFYPKITTIRQDMNQIAQTLFDSVITNTASPVREVIDVLLVVGESCKKVDLI